MAGLPVLTSEGGSRGQICLRLAVATGCLLTGRAEASQVWGQLRGVVVGVVPSSGAPVYSSVKWSLCGSSPPRWQV